MTEVASLFRVFLPFLATVALVVVFLAFCKLVPQRRWKDDPNAQFRFQLIMLALTFAGVLAVVVALPVNDALRGQLLSLIGILLSAAIALSSTTFIGNIMAGIMLRIVKKREARRLHHGRRPHRPDYRDGPAAYRDSDRVPGSRHGAESVHGHAAAQGCARLGYDNHGRSVFRLRRRSCAGDRRTVQSGRWTQASASPLPRSASSADYSVVLSRSGSARRSKRALSPPERVLRAAMLDSLHAAGIEIVSPGFHEYASTRRRTHVFIPAGRPGAQASGCRGAARGSRLRQGGAGGVRIAAQDTHREPGRRYCRGRPMRVRSNG